jgi:uncharacterized membrane protein YqgA involved in biofilm formation
MQGYRFNGLLVFAGSMPGLFAWHEIRDGGKETVFFVLSLVTLFVGLRMSMNGVEIIPIVFCLAVGAVLGCTLRWKNR